MQIKNYTWLSQGGSSGESALQNASVQVFAEADTGLTTPLPIFQDSAGATPWPSNTATSDVNGFTAIAVGDGNYSIRATSQDGTLTQTIQDQFVDALNLSSSLNAAVATATAAAGTAGASQMAAAASNAAAGINAASAAASANNVQIAVNAALAVSRIYATSAAGLSATSSGQYFFVLQTVGGYQVAELYLNSSGSAVDQNYSVPGLNAVVAVLNNIASLALGAGAPLLTVQDSLGFALLEFYSSGGFISPHGIGISNTGLNAGTFQLATERDSTIPIRTYDSLGFYVNLTPPVAFVPSGTSPQINRFNGISANGALIDPVSSALLPIKEIYVTERAPTQSDDTTLSYNVGDYWTYKTALYVCQRNTAADAMWQLQSPTLVPLGNSVQTAVGLYGIYKLNSAYSGNCMQLVATVGGSTVTQNIGFVGQSVDYVAADAFAGTADAGTTVNVGTLYDQSGNGNDMIQTTRANMPMWLPTGQGGLRGIMMSPQNVNRVMGFNAGSISLNPQAFSMALLARRPTTAGCIVQLGSVAGSPLTIGSSLNSSSPLVTNYYASGYGNNAMYVPLEAGAPNLALLTAGSAGWSWSCNDNTYSSSAPMPALTGLTGLNLGGVTSNPGQMEVFAFAAWGRQLTAADIGSVKAWAYQPAFGIQPQVRDALLLVGDSRTAGTGTTNLQAWGFQMAPQIRRPYRLIINGLPGTTAAAVNGYVANFTSKVFYPGGQNVAVVSLGVNDVDGGETGAAAWADQQTLVASIKSAGAVKVVGCTCLGNNAATSIEITNYAALNALITGSSGVYAAVANFAGDPTIGPQSATANTALYGDGLHPTNLGASFEASIGAAVINSFG